MRISDWSSDVCSSDLLGGDLRGQRAGHPAGAVHGAADAAERFLRRDDVAVAQARRHRLRQADDVEAELLHVGGDGGGLGAVEERSEEHTSELQSIMRISYAVFCLKKKNNNSAQYTD